MKKYRIGDFARELGVTPDFLKYCEHKGVITPLAEPNGYRYYEFTQAAPVIEYMKLKNQAFTGEEIYDILHESSFEESIAHMQSRRADIERRMAFDEALLGYYDELQQIFSNFGEEPVWQVRRTEGLYFLPHSVDLEFIGEEAIRDCVRAWNPYMPVVMSTKRLPLSEDGRLLAEGEGLIWGFSVREEFAARVVLPIAPPVSYVPPCRCLEVFLKRSLAVRKAEYLRYAEAVMERNGLRPAGDAHCRVIAKIWEDGVRMEYSVLYIPVEG